MWWSGASDTQVYWWDVVPPSAGRVAEQCRSTFATVLSYLETPRSKMARRHQVPTFHFHIQGGMRVTVEALFLDNRCSSLYYNFVVGKG